MAEITKKVLVLTFGTEKGKEVSLTINTPSDVIVGSDIAMAMDRVAATKAFGDGDIADKKMSAKYVMQQVEQIAL